MISLDSAPSCAASRRTISVRPRSPRSPRCGSATSPWAEEESVERRPLEEEDPARALDSGRPAAAQAADPLGLVAQPMACSALRRVVGTTTSPTSSSAATAASSSSCLSTSPARAWGGAAHRVARSPRRQPGAGRHGAGRDLAAGVEASLPTHAARQVRDHHRRLGGRRPRRHRPPPLHERRPQSGAPRARRGRVERLGATGVPIGLLADARFTRARSRWRPATCSSSTPTASSSR